MRSCFGFDEIQVFFDYKFCMEAADLDFLYGKIGKIELNRLPRILLSEPGKL